jgi:pimeloyl-ACP methyl ester carboxylesterase
VTGTVFARCGSHEIVTLLLSLASLALGPGGTAKPAIVLVHGAFADGSSWSKVIQILDADGLHP